MHETRPDPKTPTTPRPPFSTTVILALVGLVVSASAKEVRESLDLTAQVLRQHVLTPGAPFLSGTFPIEEVESFSVVFGSPSQTLEIELIAPDGQRFAIGDPDSPEAINRVFPDPDDPTATGANYLFTLTAPLPGLWSYEVQEILALSHPRTVFVSILPTSDIRAGILGGNQDYVVDREVVLALVAAEGENLLRDLSITANLRKLGDPSFAGPVVDFRDDGLEADNTPADGLYTMAFSPEETGKFQLTATIDGRGASGSPFQRTAAAIFEVQPVRALFLGSFSDRGIDSDGDGLFDEIGVSLDLQVDEPGEYNVPLTLQASNGNTLRANTVTELAVGAATVEVRFRAEDVKRALATDGPYLITEALLELLDLDPAATVDGVFDLGSTSSFALDQLERDPIEFLPMGSAKGVDTDGNGLFDFLEVILAVDFRLAGFYQWSARLVDSNSTELALSSSGSAFSSGPAELLLRFNGQSIGENGLDGPFFIRNLVVFGEDQSLIEDSPLTTLPFLASEFEGFILDQEPPDLRVSASPGVLWPPNHEMVEIAVGAEVSDNVDPDPQVRLESITSNEGDNAIGDGNTSGDIFIDSDGRIFLRAERSGLGVGRVYTLTYSATDAASNVTHATAEVLVPHEQAK